MKISHKKLADLKSKCSSKFPIPKYIIFCEEMLKSGYNIEIFFSKSTVSKYIYIRHKGREIKVRFSNHKPTRYKQDFNDSDFYVGVSNYECITTEELIPKIKELLKR